MQINFFNYEILCSRFNAIHNTWQKAVHSVSMTDYELEFNIQRTYLVRCPFTNLYALCNSGTNWDKSWMAWIQNLKTRNQPSVVGPGRILIKSSKTISFPNNIPSQPYEFYFKISIVIHHCCIHAVLLKLKISRFPYALSEVIELVILILLSSNHTFNHPMHPILGDRFFFKEWIKLFRRLLISAYTTPTI